MSHKTCDSAGNCRHYRGTVQNVCAAGINLRDLVGGEDLGWCTRLPCVEILRERANGPTAECQSFSPHTPEEEAQKKVETKKLIDESMRRMKALKPLWNRIKAEHRNKNGSGVETCPVCRGKIYWTHSSYNGHCSFQCETEGCINVIE